MNSVSLISDVPSGDVLADNTANQYMSDNFQLDQKSSPDVQNDTSTTEQSKTTAPSENTGFIKKLFTGASKAEKTAKKEAKYLKKRENVQTQIYGWYPYWNTTPDSAFNYNLLTSFSYFTIDGHYDANSKKIEFDDHGITSPFMKSLFRSASGAGCRIDITFRFDDKSTLRQLFSSQLLQDSCISSMVKIINANFVYDGICIVFENLPPNISSSLVLFMSELKVTLKPSNRTISLALPAMDYANNYNIQKLNQLVDSYILLCYNYYTKGTEAGPVSPLDNVKKNASIKASVKDYLSKGAPYSKMIAALPFYGIVWKEDTGKPNHYSFYKHWTYTKIIGHLATTKSIVQFDSVSYTYYYDFQMNGQNFRCYFDNDKSLDNKYKWLIKQGLAGVGIWALGYDRGNQDFWNMINKDFKVKKLNPLQKEVIIDNRTLRDTVYSYLLIGDSLVKHTNLVKDTLIKDTLFSKIINPAIDSSALKSEKNLLTRELDKLKTIFKPLLSDNKVLITVIIALISFGFLGIIASMLFSSVRKLLYITSIPGYIVTNVSLILVAWGLLAFLRYLKTDIAELIPGYYDRIYHAIWIIVIISWLIINLLSYKLIGTISLKRDEP